MFPYSAPGLVVFGNGPRPRRTCDAKGCTKDHYSHQCDICGTVDSKHLPENCPLLKVFAAKHGLQPNFSTGQRRCRAPECTQNHSVHKCKVCNTVDSDHCSSNCRHLRGQMLPVAIHQGQMPLPLPFPPVVIHQRPMQPPLPFQPRRCKAVGCNENHTIHKCKICKMFDSDHCSRNCPHSRHVINSVRTAGTHQGPVVIFRCGIGGCTMNHSVHRCMRCNGSTHRTSACPL